MAGLKEIRTRINSIASTQKITSAMKMVSAAKFHKAQETFYRFKRYSSKVDEVLLQVASAANDSSLAKWFAKPTESRNIALVVLSSNSSMCAGFNQNLAKKVIDEGPKLWGELWKDNRIKVFCIGKKGADIISKKGVTPQLIDTEIAHLPLFNDVSAFFTQHILEPFRDGTYDAVFIAYNEFKNPAVQEPTIRQFLPFTIPEVVTKDSKSSDNLIFEPNKGDILKAIIPMALKTSFYEYTLENAIGEHGARMTAMHQATENAIELSKQLKLQYNKARQAAITKEILEIVSGAEALRG
ncbi:ATP synthase F1 subunit gamma [Perlabentimonas gracilis]|uniref:ATP synthase F1 subunit gamma n=1 Tax=Perlabentimonas gracilis TaxID=2715279 RepID=UPI00140DAD63|nr:ATP synthase F1 subunit gamma [Perlabentimonas gracilis]NHB68045.1 ATP synthase F1 subunit gamma [Perlabentimonas gracilis]